jgi:stage II sporulation protein GA (sporulation sigma-E factor processing peptidase)
LKQKIYIDILVGVNLFINYFLLLAVSKLLSLPVKRLRLLLAASLGAVGSLSILLPEISMFFSFLLKLAMSALIVLAAYPLTGLKDFLRELAAFYVISFSFAGFMIALWYFFAPQGLIIKNSVVYFNISPLFLVGMTVICYFVIRLIHRITGRQAPEDLFCTIRIDMNGRTVSCSAKVDTGNTLKEPFSNAPVAVVCEDCISEIIPKQKEKIRLVPYQSVSGTGLLPAFKPDKLTVCIGSRKTEIHEVYIAVTKSKLGAFGALLNPDLCQKTSA